MSYGANPQDWQQFVDQGLTADLLPVVSDPGVPLHPESRLRGDNRGKVPSRIAPDGTMVGMPGWSRDRHVAADIRKWMRDDRLGVCIQTREVRAIDVDIADPAISADVRDAVQLTLGRLPCRSRPNSGKLLLAFRLPGTYLKRIIETPHGRIEFLANGQHFVAAGTHPSGVRYEWDDVAIPAIEPDEFESVWQTLAQQYGTVREQRDAAAPHNDEVLGLTDEDIRAALAVLDPDMGYDDWNKVGMALHHETRAEGLHYWQEWSATGSEYPGDEELGYKWQSFGRYTGPPVTARTIVHLAAERGVYIGPQAPATSDEFTDLTVNEDGTPKPLRFQFEHWADAATAHALPWIIKGVLPQAEIGMVYGASGSGKSFAVLDMCMAVARGIAWRGHKVRQGAVAYVVAEGAAGFLKRLEAYGRHFQIEDRRAVPLQVLRSAPNLREKKDADDIAAAVAAMGGATLVVVDTLAQVTPGANENASEDMNTAVINCRRVHRATGAMVLLVHHSGKDATRGARGWSGLRGAMDAEIEVTRTPKGQRELQLTKSKDGEDGKRWGFDLEVVQLGMDEDGDEITSCVVVEVTTAEAAPYKPRGKNQTAVLEAVRELTGGCEGATADVDDVLRLAAERVADGKKDPNGDVRRNLREALRGMLDDVNAPFVAGSHDSEVIWR